MPRIKQAFVVVRDYAAMMRRNQKRCFPPYLAELGIRLMDIEWEPVPISPRAKKLLKAQAAKVGKIILDDWLEQAKAQQAAVERLIAADAEAERALAEQEAYRQAAERDLAETTVIVNRMIERELPVLKAAATQRRKQRKAMSKAVRRERAKLEAESRRLAQAKLARLRKR